jgi:hypothetical protein
VEVIDVSSATILVAERGVAEIEQIPSFRFRKAKRGCLVLQVHQH